MEVSEVLNHDWKEGEEVYVVCHSLCLISKKDDLMGEKPYKVVKGKVSKVERDIHPNWQYLEVELKVKDGLKKNIREDKNNVICAMETKFSDSSIRYSLEEYCLNKFFTEKEAEDYIKKDIENWNNYISKKAVKNTCLINKMEKAIDELKKENIAIQKQLILST